MHKRVAIVQSNYIPWKGYFDLIASVDEFILYDDVQFTRRDWRTRNQIKTPHGLEWISVPVGGARDRRIREVKIPASDWQALHWKTLEHHYRKAAHFEEVAGIIRPLYLEMTHTNLSAMNRLFLETICRYLGIRTRLTNSWDYALSDGKSERLLDICKQAGATEYLSGPSAKDYLDEALFTKEGIAVRWFDYAGYPEYPQLWGPFEHAVTILDLLFNCGQHAPDFMKVAHGTA